MARGPGTIIKQTANRFLIRTTTGVGCSACDELAKEMDEVGPEGVLARLDEYVEKFQNSIENWERANGLPVVEPPRATIEIFIRYACGKSIKESAALR